jgi:hypothetical protein
VQGQFVFHRLPAGCEGPPDSVLKGVAIARDLRSVELDFDMAGGTEAAVVRQAELLG